MWPTNFYGRSVEVSSRANNICRRIPGSTTRASSRSTAAWFLPTHRPELAIPERQRRETVTVSTDVGQ